MARKGRIIGLKPGAKQVSLLMEKRKGGRNNANRAIHKMLINPDIKTKDRLIRMPLDPNDPHLKEWLKNREVLAKVHLKPDYVKKLEQLRKEAKEVGHSLEYDIGLDKEGRPRLYLAYDTKRSRKDSPRRRQVISQEAKGITVESYWDNPDHNVENFHKKIYQEKAMEKNPYGVLLAKYAPYNEAIEGTGQENSSYVFYRMIDEALKHYKDIMTHFK